MFAKRPKPLLSFPKQQLSNPHFFFSTPTTLHTPLSSLPPRPSINQTKQAHAQIIVSGLGANASFTGHLLASLALSPSTPFAYSLSIFQTIQYPSLFASNNMIRCLAKIKLWLYVKGLRVECSKRVFEENGHCRDVVTWNSMLAGFVRDGRIGDAEKVFDEMPERDVISWSTMIMGHVQNGQLEEGLECFKEMREKGLRPNEAILVTVLSASAQMGLLENGRLVHSIVDSLNFPMTVSLGTALVDMYAKCGCIEQSKLLFHNMPRRDISSWNAMICGLASHGLGKEALALFERFINEGFHPVSVTFIGVLNACSRAGLVSEGRHYFKLMTEKYDIELEMEHYGCMVDLLSRAGFVDEAVELIEKMQAPPDPVLWATLLGACKIHGSVELGEKIGNKLIKLDPTYDGHYVQLASIYAKARKWEDVVRVRRLMVEQNTNKVAGWSLIEAQGRVHQFVAGDREHERSLEIYKMLETIGTRIAEAGYSPKISSVLHDIGEEEKENVVKEHSERLAIAYGMLVTKVGDCIRIVKNLRVCEDCHEASKMISMVFDREIIVRDYSRFHHFKEGKSERDNHPVLLAAAVVAAARSTLCPPSLQTLLEDVPELGILIKVPEVGSRSMMKFWSTYCHGHWQYYSILVPVGFKHLELEPEVHWTRGKTRKSI
ncbi:hypothetical protein CMV_024065 [Castanea mollissima]|uniref:DYW domain-containing protein n=1 Tax=Castanea mollissima TaxID=60419 RepID=A0A8J4VIE2_9ROSI|nr:hypothetical protein CMV_024065 [Castanea mollissima]